MVTELCRIAFALLQKSIATSVWLTHCGSPAAVTDWRANYITRGRRQVQPLLAGPFPPPTVLCNANARSIREAHRHKQAFE